MPNTNMVFFGSKRERDRQMIERHREGQTDRHTHAQREREREREREMAVVWCISVRDHIRTRTNRLPG